MKYRLKSLMALLLCMSIVFNPFCGALAQIFYADSNGGFVDYLMPGDLISASVNLRLESVSGIYDLHYYGNGLYDANSSPTYKFDSGTELLAHTVLSTSTASGFETDRWAVAASNDSSEDSSDRFITKLERVGKFVEPSVKGTVSDKSVTLVISRGLQSFDGYAFSDLPISEREAALRASLSGDNWSPVFYQITPYTDLKGAGGVWRRADFVTGYDQIKLDSPVTITLPWPADYDKANFNADDFVLMHLTYDLDTESRNVDSMPYKGYSDAGIQFEIDSFSPYMLAYKPASQGDNDNTGTGDNTGDGTGSNAGTANPDDAIPAPDTSALPKTGDSSSLMLWLALAVVSGMAIISRRRIRA